MITDPGGRGTPYNGLYRKAPHEKGSFFGLQVYARVGILIVEVHERVGKSVIWVCAKGPKGRTDEFYDFIESSTVLFGESEWDLISLEAWLLA